MMPFPVAEQLDVIESLPGLFSCAVDPATNAAPVSTTEKLSAIALP
jgi:hypothetical protein